MLVLGFLRELNSRAFNFFPFGFTLSQVILHPLSEFISPDLEIGDTSPTYWYEGHCPHSGDLLRLPRTPLIEAIARGLMQRLSIAEAQTQEGKMYGVLLVETPTGELRVLKAFSGLLNGCSVVTGWVPPIPGREQVALEESSTLALLEEIKRDLIELDQIPERQQHQALQQQFEARLKELAAHHQQQKQQRQEQRQLLLQTLSGAALNQALAQLDEQSRQAGIERRRLKRQRDEVLQPLQRVIEAADLRILELKRQRKALSRQLQAQMHAAYRLTNFWGESASLQELIRNGAMPTGTGDCCAPKLLHYAATHQLKPLALAEFWWGAPSANGDKISGKFYEACVDRCQPIMGFLLSGLTISSPTRIGTERSLSILYEDEWLIAVNKPAGLLSVPGRYRDRQDSVLSRLQSELLDGNSLMPAHRLDQDTSGILLLARDRQTYLHLSQQFQQRHIHKVYEAVLAGSVKTDQGVIDLPLWGDPSDRPRQSVNWEHGKPSVTQFRVMNRENGQTRLELVPITGRTHQLRVHAAHPDGLGIPILGDRLYGCSASTNRLHLHARALEFKHPQMDQYLHLKTNSPF
jgi:tRNA pseudouridine32 synthase / 23S rRNA pseudouridine746 synthase